MAPKGVELGARPMSQADTATVEARVLSTVLTLIDAEPGRPVEVDTDLRSAGLDSVKTVSLLMALEDEFDVEFPDELLTPETFSTVTTISAAVRQLSADGLSSGV
jgi:acyl carrier protein